MENINKKLLDAIYVRSRRKILKLLKKGAEVNWADEDGRTILMHAILAENASFEIVELLIKNGANVRVCEPEQQWTALHFAAREGHSDIVKLLLENGAEVDAKDSFGNTPLWRAVMTFKGDDRVIRLLLSHKADMNIENNYGISPLEIAKTSADARELDILLSNSE